MTGKRRKLYKRIFFIVTVFFLLINLILIGQAYHLTHFYEHGTVKSIEEQTGSFRNQAQVVLFGLKQEKLIGTKPDSAFSNIKLKTKDSLVLDAWLIRVAHSKGTIALFHGHGSEKSANLSQSNTFNEMGYSTILVDFRAHGQSEGNTCTIGYREAEDIKLVYDFLEKNGEKNIILYGISMGAATVTKAINDYDLAPKKIILEMPFASLNETAEGKMRMAGLPAEPLASLLTFWGGAINGFWAFNMRPKEFVKKIKCPVLLQWGRQDKGVSGAEINEIFKNISSTKKLVVYEKSGHENLCENEPEKWEGNIDAFLEQ
ncbi:alpha/beta hydrolase [Ferruginibacter sp. SUN106]|uniref:alpha/beta hydrolase n=1 Tax=Ferruginibacter sp. SUN106 TaxID=2978348 RepID=UPI003D360ADB